ncbi:MAG TPA: DUF47 family protein [Pirellulaceae bacterium]|nr:DUF47 family protein [Pirellulaceae bacterium]
MFGLLPKNLEFFDHFEQAAQLAVKSAKMMAEFSKLPAPRTNELVNRIVETEHECDKVTHNTLDRLEQTYITPIDRDDIYRLITGLDNVVDMIDAVAQRMMYYKIDQVTDEFQNQCDVLVKACQLMLDAVSALKELRGGKSKANGPQLDKLLIAVHEAEEEGDSIHHRFLGRLFDCGLDPFQVIKWKELYELVEKAIDYCDDVACLIHSIVLKNV